MLDKYLIVDVTCNEFWFVEMTLSQLTGMEWLAEKLDYDIRFFKMDSMPNFEEV